jgi:uncharacterized protein (TIGR02996 family)
MARKKKVTGHDAAFLADVVAHPEDDAPRLVYADWLEDNGQPLRAELIRVQCRLAAMGEHDPERLALEQRQDDLLLVHGGEWSATLPAWARGEYHCFRRGFVDAAGARALMLRQRGAGLFAVAPVTELRLRAAAGRAADLAALPLLARLRSLHLEPGLGAADLGTLLASPHLAGLTGLSLGGIGSLRDAVPALAAWPGLARLRSLDLAHLGEAAAAALGRAPLPSLRRLRLASSHLGAAAAGDLARNCPELTHLDLSYSPLSREALAALEEGLPALKALKLAGLRVRPVPLDYLADSGLPGRLESLEIGSASSSSADALSRLRPGARLRRLVLNATSLRDEPFAPLASAPLPGLVTLEAIGADLTAGSARRLAASPHLASLRALNLGGNAIGDEGARALAESPHLRGLERLELARCGIGPEGARALAASASLSRLRTLRLDSNALGADGVRALAASPHWGELRVLSLSNAQAGAEGLRALARSSGLPELRRLLVTANGVMDDDEVLQEFADPSRLPRLLVLALDWPSSNSTAGVVRLGRSVLV